jgi:uncharacterized protein (TIGR02246 family)
MGFLKGATRMLRIALVCAAVAACSVTALAGPKEEAQAVADKFISAFIAGDLEGTIALYSPDAVFWGTESRDLGTSTEALRKYFTDNYAARATVPLKSTRTLTDTSTLVLSDDTVVIAGRWQTERPNAVTPLRFTMVVHKKDGQWRIVHLHSSPRPKAP